ncbi:hypothetical protein D9M70_399770 [compost metagenome]
MPVGGLHQKSEQRQRAALPLVVGAQQEQHVLDRDDNRQRPDHQRDQADNLHVGHAVVGNRAQRFAKGIERAGADIAVDDTDRAKPEDQQAAQILRLVGGGMRLGHANLLAFTASLSSGRRKRG